MYCIPVDTQYVWNTNTPAIHCMFLQHVSHLVLLYHYLRLFFLSVYQTMT